MPSRSHRLPCAGVSAERARCTNVRWSAEQARRPACVTINISLPISPPDPVHMSHLGARLPQERVNSFIFDVIMVSNRLAFSMICSISERVHPALQDAGLVGQAGRGRLRVALGHVCIAFVGQEGGSLGFGSRGEGS